MSTAVSCAVRADPTYSGRQRWSCDCGGTLVHQPYMGDAAWSAASASFFEAHGAPVDADAPRQAARAVWDHLNAYGSKAIR